MQRWRLFEHGSDDLLEGDGAQSQTPCQREVLFLHSGVLVFVMGVSVACPSGFQLIDVLATARHLIFFVVLFRPLAETKMG